MNKQIIFALCLVFGLSTFAYGKPPRHQPDFNNLAEELGLSDEQIDSFVSVMQEQHQQRVELHQQRREDIKSQMKALDEDIIVKLEPILSEEQLQEFKNRMEKRKEERRRHRVLHAQQ